MTASGKLVRGLRTFAADVAEGFFEITHNGLALLGVVVLLALAALAARPDLRQAGEAQLMGWLQARQIAALGMVPELDAIDRATAANPKDLPKQQAAIAYWLSRKYRVAPEPLSALVSEAFELGAKAKLDPTLILAVMAVESGFNPFAQSPVGAQGLMQVMTGVHSDKYEIFGGRLAAFDPVTNLRVGVKVLQECIQRAGSLTAGLKFYVGAAHLPDDGGYVDKVMAEHARLQQVAAGRAVPLAPAVAAPATAPLRTVAPAPLPLPKPEAEAPTPDGERVATLSLS
ncbi:MAG TPA: lytic transglycosylase domain-containing protein [Ramlibacter sp.]|nr:lytic transglycosylase domain-containing protein [Ramlibacter sp.]